MQTDTPNLQKYASLLLTGGLNSAVSNSSLSKEWDLIIDEPCKDIFSWPLLNPSFCEHIINIAESHNCWQSDRHEFYPTTDVTLSKIGLNEIYNKILKNYVYEAAIHKWQLEGDTWTNLEFENFVIKYTAENQSHLSLHHDHSKITSIVSLNDNFCGGGTFFKRQNFLLENPVGHVAIHPGTITHKHGARPITEGTRYVLVTFAN